MFKKGDVVRRKNGESFSNGKYELTVAELTTKFNNPAVTFQETGTWCSTSSVELVVPSSFKQVASDLEKRISELEEEAYQAEKIAAERDSYLAELLSALEVVKKVGGIK